MIPAAATQPILSARNIEKYYGELRVLKGVSLDINKGEIVSMVGPSGSGKSTLLHILGTLDLPRSGEIILESRPLHTLKGKPLAAFRNRHIGFVFQFHHLLPEFTALENVCIPGWIAGRKKSEVRAGAIQLLNILGVGHRTEHKPAALSGGEQQRVAVCRALINHPDIVFADEPTGNLDSANAQELHRLFFDLRRQFNQTFLIVTHNEALAEQSDRVLHMKDGSLIP
ncbi:MAG TPA: ABC transporter ATP-binding protein [Puia sp.]|jgi:lipoprotein-releasing system ATP-binding protein